MNRKTPIAIAFVAAVALSLFVANVRERVRRNPLILGMGMKPQSVGFGWPLVSIYQEDRTFMDQVWVNLIDQDFPGEEAAVDSPVETPVNRRFVMSKSWFAFGQPISSCSFLRLVANVTICTSILLSSIIMARRWRQSRAELSLVGLFIWITCVAMFLGFRRVSRDEEFAEFWSRVQSPQVDLLDTLYLSLIASGCTCAVYWGWSAIHRLRAPAKLNEQTLLLAGSEQRSRG